MPETDPETQRVFKEGEKAYYLVRSEDWKWAKRKLLQKLSNLDSVKTLKEKGNIPEEIKVRKRVIDIIIEWLDDIEGIAEQHLEQNKDLLEKVEEEDYIHVEED